MEPQDPKTYLWTTLKRRLGLPDDAGVDAVFGLLQPSGLSRGTVQRIKEGKTSLGMDNLLKIAKHFKIEIWELCVPPGAVEQLRPSEIEAPPINVAFSALERALATVEPSGLQNLLDTIALLVTETTNKEHRRKYVLSILSGELQTEELQRKVSNG